MQDNKTNIKKKTRAPNWCFFILFSNQCCSTEEETRAPIERRPCTWQEPRRNPFQQIVIIMITIMMMMMMMMMTMTKFKLWIHNVHNFRHCWHIWRSTLLCYISLFLGCWNMDHSLVGQITTFDIAMITWWDTTIITIIITNMLTWCDCIMLPAARIAFEFFGSKASAVPRCSNAACEQKKSRF